jgi:hypothetical protein
MFIDARALSLHWKYWSPMPMGTWALPDAARSDRKLWLADRYFIVPELVLLALFFWSLGAAGQRFAHPLWLVLWAIVLAGTVIPLAIRFAAPARARPDIGRSPAPARAVRVAFE